MSAVSLPVTRPVGRALVVAGSSARLPTIAALQQLGYACGEADDPYVAVLELCRHPGGYQSVVLGLTSLFKEELVVVQTIKQRFPQVEVWLTQTDGRPAAIAEALRLGADGLLGEDGLHRLAVTAPARVTEVAAAPPSMVPAAVDADGSVDDDSNLSEPILTADELRALLQETPSTPI